MVMSTRHYYKKACESLNESDVSNGNINPPWCSSGKLFRRKRRHSDSMHWEVSSEYPMRENIWEYLYEGNSEKLNGRKNKTCSKHTLRTVKNNGRVRRKIIVCFVIIVLATLVSLRMTNKIPKLDLFTKVVPRTEIMRLLGLKERRTVIEECCYNIRYLEAKLFKAEQLLRNSVRRRKSKLLPETNEVSIKLKRYYYIYGATVLKGDATKEWGGRVALWGVIPLWRASRPLETVVSLRKPTPGDCWPFIGTNGEIIIELAKICPVSGVSIEHIYPDAAQSAPKHFAIYGIQANATLVKIMNGNFDNTKPTKQHYYLNRVLHLRSVILRIVTNSGNPKYTCVYRVHVYNNVNEDFIS